MTRLPLESCEDWRRVGRGRELQFFATDEEVQHFLAAGLPSAFAPYSHGLAENLREDLIDADFPITNALLSRMWLGYWALLPHFLTPQGPFTESSTLPAQGVVESGHRLWMLQHALNAEPDSPAAPESFPLSSFLSIFSAKQYRILHRYQAKLLVDAEGRIRRDSVWAPGQVADNGPTKLRLGIVAGEFLPYWNNPDLIVGSTTLASDTNQFNATKNYNAEGTKISGYATGRVGWLGQNPNWRLFGKDAPWIFSEIVFGIDGDRNVEAVLRTSVDIAWRNGALESGTAPFNNLTLYKQRLDLSTLEIIVERQELLEMEGHLEAFIESASGVWPEPPIPPSVQ